MERQLQAQEMMVPHQGMLAYIGEIFICYFSHVPYCFHSLSLIVLQDFHLPCHLFIVSLFLIVNLVVNSAESGSEGSSDASDENTNQQVCVFLYFSLIWMAKELAETFTTYLGGPCCPVYACWGQTQILWTVLERQFSLSKWPSLKCYDNVFFFL